MDENHIDDNQINARILEIATSLHGIPVGQARAILDDAKAIITICSDVDVNNPRFVALIEEGRKKPDSLHF